MLKDKRYKLTDDKKEFVSELYHKDKYTMHYISLVVGVSRQRVSQILDLNNTLQSHRQKDTAKRKVRYNTDKQYRESYLESKRIYYIINTFQDKCKRYTSN